MRAAVMVGGRHPPILLDVTVPRDRFARLAVHRQVPFHTVPCGWQTGATQSGHRSHRNGVRVQKHSRHSPQAGRQAGTHSVALQSRSDEASADGSAGRVGSGRAGGRVMTARSKVAAAAARDRVRRSRVGRAERSPAGRPASPSRRARAAKPAPAAASGAAARPPPSRTRPPAALRPAEGGQTGRQQAYSSSCAAEEGAQAAGRGGEIERGHVGAGRAIRQRGSRECFVHVAHMDCRPT